MKNGKILNSLLLILLLGVAIPVGCGGGGGSGTSSGDDANGITDGTNNTDDTTAPTVDGTSPSDGATGVSICDVITITFSEVLDETTVTTDTITLTNTVSGESVSGTVSHSSGVVTFTPSTCLDLLGQYQLTITTEIKDANGNRLDQEATQTFTTGNGSWRTVKNVSEPIETGTNINPRVVMNRNTDAIFVWQNEPSGGGTNNIYSRYYTAASSSWADVSQPESGSGHAIESRVALDDNGNAIIIFSQYPSGNSFRLYTNSYNRTDSWGSEAVLDDNSSPTTGAEDIAMDANGNAIAIFTDSDNVYGRYYTVSGDSWGAASLIGDFSSSAQLAMNDSGAAVVLGMSGTDIVASRYSSSSWGSASVIDSQNGSVDDPVVAIDPDGNAIAVWLQSDDTRNNVWVNIFDGSSWGTAGLLETGSGDADEPQVAIADDGTAIVVWKQNDGSVNNIYAIHYDGATWGSGMQLSDGTANTDDPQIAVDRNGNAIAVWSEDLSTDAIYAARYVASTDLWGESEQIDEGGYDAGSPQIAIDGYGAATAVWSQGPANNKSIVANRFQ